MLSKLSRVKCSPETSVTGIGTCTCSYATEIHNSVIVLHTIQIVEYFVRSPFSHLDEAQRSEYATAASTLLEN